jgi:deazaflavin-dependent oxidoreductase (nitroreductase family)
LFEEPVGNTGQVRRSGDGQRVEPRGKDRAFRAPSARRYNPDGVRHPMISPFPRLYFGIEYFLLNSVSRDRPRGIMRWVFRIPVWLYRFGLGFMIGNGVLLLATTGRRSGKRRITALGFGRDPAGGSYTVAAGWTGGADWYRNAVAHPEVQIWLGRAWIDCRAQPLPPEESVEGYRKLRSLNPYADRIFSKWLGRPFSPTEENYLAVAGAFPSLNLVPVRNSTKGEDSTQPLTPTSNQQ